MSYKGPVLLKHPILQPFKFSQGHFFTMKTFRNIFSNRTKFFNRQISCPSGYQFHYTKQQWKNIWVRCSEATSLKEQKGQKGEKKDILGKQVQEKVSNKNSTLMQQPMQNFPQLLESGASMEVDVRKSKNTSRWHLGIRYEFKFRGFLMQVYYPRRQFPSTMVNDTSCQKDVVQVMQLKKKEEKVASWH